MRDPFAGWAEQLDNSLHNITRVFKNQFESQSDAINNKKLNAADLELLDLLDKYPGISVKDAIEHLNAPNSTMTSLLNRLEKDGILKRQIHAEDKRTFILNLTKKGQEFVQKRKAEKQYYYYYLLQQLDTDQERMEFMRLLDKIHASVNDADINEMRRIYMTNLKKEFDQFGPWLTVIKELEDVPQQFMHLKDQILDSVFAFKVPIQVARRDLKIGMPLYEKVVVLTEDKVVIMTRHEEDRIEIEEMKQSDIVYLRYVDNLLDGKLIFGSAAGEQVVGFNTVSIDVVEQVVDIIRKTYIPGNKTIDFADITEPVDVQSFLFRNLLAAEMKKENVQAIEYQPFMELSGNEDIQLQDSLFVTNGKELIVMNRVKEVKTVDDADYGYRYTFVPVERIESLTLEPDQSISGLQELALVLDGARITFEVGSDFSVDLLNKVLKL